MIPSVFRYLLSRLSASEAGRVRRLVNRIETFQERRWERRLHKVRLPSDGELTAILRRNGYAGFYQYIVGQKAGHFGRRNFTPANQASVVEQLNVLAPEEAKRIKATADSLLLGEFNLLGSGKVQMGRGRGRASVLIDWNKDPISGERYQSSFSNYRWNPMKFKVGQSDVKGPWELSRSQHFPLLGQAFWLTGDERYAQAFADTISDFIDQNPVGVGVHWACNMDVSLRVVSWLLGLSYFQGSDQLTTWWWRKFLKSLLQHGRFMLANLEFGTLEGKVIVSNHGLANLFGLYWLALNFPGIDAGVVWRGVAAAGLEEQIKIQVLDDGGCFESSVPYHRLVMEMFLSAYALGRHHNILFSPEYHARLKTGLLFLGSLRQPGGRFPQIGDADNGRAHVLSGYGAWEDEQENMDHLLAAGAAVFDWPELDKGLSAAASVEKLFWRDRDDKPGEVVSEQVAVSQVFRASGLALLRGGPSYVVLTNSVCGTFGIGNHKHNDQLAIEWVVGEQPVFVDAGSYTYTQNPDARNLFRSTRSHNTVLVAGEEQHGMEPSALFRLVQRGTPHLGEINEAGGVLGIEGEHNCYKDIVPPVTHKRRLTLFPDGQLLLEDFFSAPAKTFEWNFVLHPGVKAFSTGTEVVIKAPSTTIATLTGHIEWHVEQGWYSSGYGRRVVTDKLVARYSGESTYFPLLLCPEVAKIADFAGIAAKADSFWQ